MLAVRWALWAALFATGNADGSSLRETMTYFIVGDIAYNFIVVRYGNSIGSDIQSGDIATRLIKPFPYHLQLVSMANAMASFSTLTYSLPLFIAAAFLIGLLPPISAAAFGFFLLTTVLAGVIYNLIELLISYSAFWLTDYWHLSWFRGALFTLFGGGALPLWFYPEWLHTICGYLPFKYAVYQPMAVYLGRVPVDEIGTSLLMQLFWIAVLFAAERFVWHRAQSKMAVQGG